MRKMGRIRGWMSVRNHTYLFAAMIPLTGCGFSLAPPPAGIPAPAAPDYLQITKALGIWDILEKSSMTLPGFLNDVPGVDGEGPFQVEVLRDVPYKVAGDRTMTVNIHRPVVDDGKLRRAVVLFMGGGFLVDVDFEIMEVWADYMASRGLVVFNPKTRLITEPNVTLLNAFSDAFAAIRFIVASGSDYGADPERIGVMGRSSGGHLALLVGMFDDPDKLIEEGDPDAPVKVHAMVDIFGPVDYARLATGEDWSLVPSLQYVSAIGCFPADCPDAYAAISPISYVRAGLPPALIVHGYLDTTVPIAQSARLADALEAQGNIVEREFQADTGHVIGWGLFNNDGFGRAMSRVIRFFEARL